MQSFADWLFGTFQKFCSYAEIGNSTIYIAPSLLTPSLLPIYLADAECEVSHSASAR